MRELSGMTENPVLPIRERIFAGAVYGPAILDNTQAADRILVLDPVVQLDYAVGNVLLDAIPREFFAADSAVITAVTPLLFSHVNKRRSSARRICIFENPLNKFSIVSRTTRLAPNSSIAIPRRMKIPEVKGAGLLVSHCAQHEQNPYAASCVRRVPQD